MDARSGIYLGISMVYKIIWIGLGVFVLAGTLYLGTVGISVTKRSVQLEIPLQKFIKPKL
jgi:hypothetical protein